MTPHRAGSYNSPISLPSTLEAPATGASTLQRRRSIPMPTHAFSRTIARLTTIAPLLVIASFAPTTPASCAAAAPAPRSPRTVRVLAEDPRSVRIEYVAGRARWDTLAIGDVRYERVQVEGAVMIEPPGRPALPTDLIQIGVPDGMSPTVRIETEESDERPGLPPAPAVTQRFISDDPAKGPVSEFRYVPESAIYAGVRLHPEAAAALGTGVPLGELWSVPLRVTPVRWNPATRSYRVLRRLVLRVDFVPATDREAALRVPGRPGSDTESWRPIRRDSTSSFARRHLISLRFAAWRRKPL